MCGIAGFASNRSTPEADLIIRRMTDAIAHRGPDDSGFYTDGCAALGHRRLSIVDLPAGHQPMANESGTLQIVYNGEIFNHTQLRTALEGSGHTYRTHCDTETIVHAYEQHGPQCLSLFRGMFAFAVWDAEKKRLFCARDRLGKKPFYYFRNGSLFAFASEIKSLLRHPAISAEFESESLSEYLAFGYLSGENTLFRGIQKLQPGHYLTLDFAFGAPRLEITQYWDVPAAKPTRASERELIDETRRLLEETVRLRLMSDVPLGIFLSGGVDSSAVAAIATRLTGAPIQTFSVGYTEASYSELGYAAQVAHAIGASHHEVRIGMNEFFDALPRLIWHEDEPIAWPSSVPLYFVSKLAAKRVKVVLTGEGSDELFGGYERYRWNVLNARAASVYEHLPQSIRERFRGLIQSSSLIRADLRRKLNHTFLLRDLSIESLYLDNFYSAFPSREQGRLLGAGVGAIYDNYLPYYDHQESASLLARMLYADQKTYLVELLMKQDQMSMAASIESRVPLLDHELVEFASTIPDSLKIRRGVQKYIFKKAIEDLVPREVVFRKKMGFPTPLRTWLLDERARSLYDAILNPSGFVASLVDLRLVEQLIQRHLNRQEDATDRIWRLLTLELWANVWISGADAQRHSRALEDNESPNPLLSTPARYGAARWQP